MATALVFLYLLHAQEAATQPKLNSILDSLERTWEQNPALSRHYANMESDCSAHRLQHRVSNKVGIPKDSINRAKAGIVFGFFRFRIRCPLCTVYGTLAR
jgi:hypothetical protein